MTQRTLEQPAVQDAAGTRSATLAGIGAILFWSTSGLTYATGTRTIGILPYLCLTSALAVLTIVVLKLFQRQSLLQLVTLPRRIILAGLFGIVLYSLLFNAALGLADERFIAQVTLLNYLWPLWMVLLSMRLLGHASGAGYALIGCVLGFIGVALAGIEQLQASPPTTWWPHAMTFAAGFLWALYSVLLRRWRISPEQGGSTLQFFIAAIVAGAIAAARGDWADVGPIDATGAFLILFGGIAPVGLAYYWWEIGVKRGNVHLLAVLAYFIPIVSAALIALVFRQSMSPWLIPGACLIALGAWLGRRAVPAD